jgi:hypothetical protein
LKTSETISNGELLLGEVVDEFYLHTFYISYIIRYALFKNLRCNNTLLAHPVSCFIYCIFFFETESYCVAQAGLELMILLPLPPKYHHLSSLPSGPASLNSFIFLELRYGEPNGVPHPGYSYLHRSSCKQYPL